MKIFVAGASGVIGRRLTPLLTAAGHEVAGMTRLADKANQLREVGADPVVCDVFDVENLTRKLSWQPGFASWREGFATL